mgnify:CR=1 FL=1
MQWFVNFITFLQKQNMLKSYTECTLDEKHLIQSSYRRCNYGEVIERIRIYTSKRPKPIYFSQMKKEEKLKILEDIVQSTQSPFQQSTLSTRQPAFPPSPCCIIL